MNNFIDVLNHHLNKYPLMQAEDIYKLAYQFYFGPAHFINDIDKAYSFLLEEVKQVEQKEIEVVDVGEYVRFHLINDKNYLSILFDAFVKSSKTSDKPITGFIKLLDTCIDYLNNKDLLSIKEKMKELGYPPISHSEIYKNNYYPHYRLINKGYAQEIFDYLAKKN